MKGEEMQSENNPSGLLDTRVTNVNLYFRLKRLRMNVKLTMLMLLILLIVAKCLISTTVKPSDFKIELVQTIFRHGDRTPIFYEIYPTAPYNASSFEPYGLGQLTNVGKKREYQIGEVLRNLYNDFLGDTYKPSEVYAYSTDFDRTKMSLQLVLAGLYPPTEKSPYTAFSTTYNRLELDFLLPYLACPNFKRLKENVLNSPAFKNKLSKYDDLINHIMKNAGYPEYNNDIIFLMFHALRTHKKLGLPLPEWISREQYDEFKEYTNIVYNSIADPSLVKIATGGILKRLLDNIDNQEKKINKRKIYLYSGHDVNVKSFLAAHALDYNRYPGYGMTVIMEKLKGPNDEIFIRLRMWTGEDGGELKVLKLNGCDEICPLKKYKTIIESVLPKGNGNECPLKCLNPNILNDMANGEGNTDAVMSDYINADTCQYMY